MRIYAVYQYGSCSLKSPILVSEGFSLCAFFFPMFWLIYYRCWLAMLGVGLIEAFLVWAMVETHLGLGLFWSWQICLCSLVGFCANDWRRRALRRNGWVFDSVVAANSKEAAFVRWMDFSDSPYLPKAK
jgi:hypothetical protein